MVACRRRVGDMSATLPTKGKRQPGTCGDSGDGKQAGEESDLRCAISNFAIAKIVWVMALV